MQNDAGPNDLEARQYIFGGATIQRRSFGGRQRHVDRSYSWDLQTVLNFPRRTSANVSPQRDFDFGTASGLDGANRSLEIKGHGAPKSQVNHPSCAAGKAKRKVVP